MLIGLIKHDLKIIRAVIVDIYIIGVLKVKPDTASIGETIFIDAMCKLL